MAPNDLTPCRMAFYFVSTFAIAQTPTKQPALRLSRTKNLHFAKAPFPGFSAIEGDVFNPLDLQSAIKSQDAVIIVLGSGKDRKNSIRSEGTKNIIQAMQQCGVKRLICQSTLGAGDSNANLNFFWKNIMFGWFLKQVFLDHELQEEIVRNSGLEWTIVRPAAFTDGEKTEHYKHGFSSTDKSLILKVSRADVANFILQQLDSSHYLFKSPGLSY